MKTYVTFNKGDYHQIGTDKFDVDCIAVIECSSARDGTELAFRYFSSGWKFDYFEEDFNLNDLDKHYPRGLIPVNFNIDE